METHSFAVAQDDSREILTPCEVRATKGARWLRPIALWLVRRFGLSDVQRVRVRSFRVADGVTLLERMRLQQHDMRLIYDLQARTVLVGPDTMAAITYEAADIFRPMSPFSIGAVPVQMGYGGKIVVRGIEVVMIPWMSGTLLIPGSYAPRQEPA